MRQGLARPLAAVTTATVDVQVLRIGAKQMTLAVFRQLQRDDSFDGPLWGTVNYCHRLFGHPCAPGDPESHQHVVWQEGAELRHGMRRTLTGVCDERSRYMFAIVRQHDRFADAQTILDHAGHFTLEQLRAMSKALDHETKYASGERWIETFLKIEPVYGGWRRLYAALEEEERPFTSIPQLFIAV